MDLFLTLETSSHSFTVCALQEEEEGRVIKSRDPTSTASPRRYIHHFRVPVAASKRPARVVEKHLHEEPEPSRCARCSRWPTRPARAPTCAAVAAAGTASDQRASCQRVCCQKVCVFITFCAHSKCCAHSPFGETVDSSHAIRSAEQCIFLTQFFGWTMHTSRRQRAATASTCPRTP
jgi:hypothetical protein